jgi:hypothetical protein
VRMGSESGWNGKLKGKMGSHHLNLRGFQDRKEHREKLSLWEAGFLRLDGIDLKFEDTFVNYFPAKINSF